MKFGRIATRDAQGAILAHTLRLPGRLLAKGTVLTPDAIARITTAGYADIMAARLEPGDVAEDEAARRLAAALSGQGLSCNTPGAGRTNLAATASGLFRADVPRIGALNALHEGLTIATLPDATSVAPGDMVATVKIIPFALPETIVMQAETLARAAPALRLAPFKALRTGLILTELPGLKPSVLRGTTDATDRRIRDLTGTLLPPLRAAHTEDAIAGAMRALMSQGAALLLVAGASAPVDRGDAGPAAIVRAGGEVTHFGMPVDPGNLMCLGRIGQVPAIILPGCARSPALNGIDLILARIFAGEPAGPADVAGLGVGGLLKEFSARPAPRAGRNRAKPPAIPALILAAGLSSRTAPHHKLLAPLDGTPIVARVADAVLASHASPVIAVLGHRAAEIAAVLGGKPLRTVTAPDYQAGLSASLRAGVAALPADAGAALICLGDMPLITPALINQILAAYDPAAGRLIVIPTHHGKRGNPVLWDRRFFAEMAALTGDTGARGLLLRHAEHVAEIEVNSDAVLRDFDTPEALKGVLF
jgi:molybdenum cofactor cytidylyltransferase